MNQPARRIPLALAAVLATATVLAFPSQVEAQSTTTAPEGLFETVEYRHVGPVGNRITSVVGVAGDPLTYYAGAASGGVWRTRDGGVRWEPVFDDQPVQSIGAMAVSQSDPNVVWVGTGEAHIRSNVSRGNGLYRSTDGGDSWTHVGLEPTGRIRRIRIHPTDPNTVYVAALGHLYGPQPERGVYRTTDGGENWELVLFIDEDTGVYDLEMDPGNPRILFASAWTMLIRTWGRWSGGPNGGIYRSADGGDSWQRIEGNGLPTGDLGKIGLAMTEADSRRVYALIETNANRDYGPVNPDDAVLWRSDDGGQQWQAVNWDHTLNQRPAYYTRVVAAPDDADEAHFMATRFSTTKDGGRSFERGTPGGDHHDMWIDPLMPDRMIVGHDQGISISHNRGESWMRPTLPIAQMYHVHTDRQIPYRLYGNRQDGPSISVPSNSLTGGSIPIGLFQTVGGCESGFAVPDLEDPGVVWSGCYEGILDRHDMKTGHSRTVSVWPDNPESWPAGDLRYRFQWTFPVFVSPHDHNRVYAGSQHVHRTTNAGQSWEVISPDLTTNDKTKQEKTGGLTPDDASPTYAATLFAIAESPIRDGEIWAGSNDGLVHVTRDHGVTWDNVTANLPELPEWGTISNIEPSPHDPDRVYLTVDFHQVGDNRPFIYRTLDGGESWTKITDGIPESTHSYVHVVREDPTRVGLLYAGTENGLYVSLDAGNSWSSFQGNLPPAPVHWLDIQPDFNDLVVATYGRGFWILDDITPVQALSPDLLASDDYHLFEPRAAYRFLRKESQQSSYEGSQGTNPDYGATIHFAAGLSQFPGTGQGPRQQARISIREVNGELVRSMTAPVSA
ncbi:MAG: WD40/YVTN/BNR-like repeat-containing protein, partial [Longimicrobiales bacterium]